jgi:hypothetical protein
MKTINLISVLLIQFVLVLSASSQQKNLVPDLSTVSDTTKWLLVNRKMNFGDDVSFNRKPGDGLLILKDFSFRNGKIELDIRGKDEQGISFVGFAFHGLNDSTYDAVYFRPFNFKNPERNSHSVQYISHPENTWFKLREKHPGIYENTVLPVPEPNEWFHATIVIEYPNVNVFVNNSDKSTLSISQLSERKEGWLGFWVGNNSEGWFKNLKITSE